VLGNLCRRLSEANNGGEFFLSCRKVEELTGVSRMTAWRQLNSLCFFRIIEQLSKGTKRGQQATVWRYLGKAAPDALLPPDDCGPYGEGR
jgi:hypothetical protein